MEISDIISIIGVLGIGGIIGAYITNLLNKRTQIELEIRQLNEEKYRTILVWMRCLLYPDKAQLFSFEGKSLPENLSTSDIKELAKNKVVEYYYNTLLYGSDDVLVKLKNFIQTPSDVSFTETAVAMRNELWKIKKSREIELYAIK